MKTTYTITGAIEKEIENISKRLCPMQNRLANGKLQTRSVQKGNEPVLINHKVNLRNAYTKQGREGINGYIKMIDGIVEAFKQKKANEQDNTKTGI